MAPTNFVQGQLIHRGNQMDVIYVIEHLMKISFAYTVFGSGRMGPDILILGAGIWTSSDCAKGNRLQTECVAEYKRDFEILMNLLSQLPSSTNVIWFPQPNTASMEYTLAPHLNGI
ncbi:hypothetical protein BV898_17512 [Hypsibius exemplaris]|uniref:Uncharacterized protein n=1 Tax=Hypsibius exemplaris TaxID=2072580 RepID=A0A9X6RMM1_HYPEX|nr:hypothetical protein BV898_17512 [Hypsibius exemplaris]